MKLILQNFFLYMPASYQDVTSFQHVLSLFAWSNILISFDTYRCNIHDFYRWLCLRIYICLKSRDIILSFKEILLPSDLIFKWYFSDKLQQIYCPNSKFNLKDVLFLGFNLYLIQNTTSHHIILEIFQLVLKIRNIWNRMKKIDS